MIQHLQLPNFSTDVDSSDATKAHNNHKDESPNPLTSVFFLFFLFLILESVPDSRFLRMALARPVFCQVKSQSPATSKVEPGLNLQVQKLRVPEGSPSSSDNGKIVLQPRLCTLRTYGSDPVGVIKTKNRSGEDEVSRFFATLSEYIESSKKSQDFEIISGRLAMVVFAATITMEVVTGNSLFRKMDLEGIAEAAGVCVGAVACAAVFAWFSSARNKVGRIFTVSCSTFIDSLIDQIVDGLFYEEPSDWSDEI